MFGISASSYVNALRSVGLIAQGRLISKFLSVWGLFAFALLVWLHQYRPLPSWVLWGGTLAVGAPSLTALGWMFFKSQKDTAALARLIELNPDVPKAVLMEHLGDLARNATHFRSAEQWYRRCVRAHDQANHASALHKLSSLLIAQDRDVEALAQLQRAQRSGSEEVRDIAQYMEGAWEAAYGRPAHAEKILSDLQRERATGAGDGPWASIQLNLAHAATRAGDTARQEALLIEIVDQAHGQPAAIAAMDLGVLHRVQHRHDEAKKWFTCAFERGDRNTRIDALGHSADIAGLHRDWHEAHTALQQMFNLSQPDQQAWIALQLAQVSERLGRTEEASLWRRKGPEEAVATSVDSAAEEPLTALGVPAPLSDPWLSPKTWAVNIGLVLAAVLFAVALYGGLYLTLNIETLMGVPGASAEPRRPGSLAPLVAGWFVYWATSNSVFGRYPHLSLTSEETSPLLSRLRDQAIPLAFGSSAEKAALLYEMQELAQQFPRVKREVLAVLANALRIPFFGVSSDSSLSSSQDHSWTQQDEDEIRPSIQQLVLYLLSLPQSVEEPREPLHLDCSDTYWNEADFSALTSDLNVNFSGAEFRGSTNFSTVTFGEKTRFSGASFDGDVDFSTCLWDDIDLYRAEFHGRTDFSEGYATGSADFSGTTFSGDVQLDSLGIAGGLFAEAALFEDGLTAERALWPACHCPRVHPPQSADILLAGVGDMDDYEHLDE